jgi:ATP phosphoribosyltransferase regulatory subunit
MLIDGILKTGLTKFQISVGNVEYFKGICEAAGLDADTERDLRDALSGKNYFKVQDLLKDRNVAEIYRDQIMRITGFMRDGKDLEEAREKTSSRRAQAALERLLDLDRLLEDYGFEKYVSYDLSLLSRYQYYTGDPVQGLHLRRRRADRLGRPL